MLDETTLLHKYAFFTKAEYEPHQKQKLFHNSEARFRLANCGRRFGKTKMIAMEAASELMLPNKRIWIVGESYTVAEKEFRVVYDVIVRKLKLPVKRKIYNKEQGTMIIEMPWDSIIECKSAKYPDLLVGDDLDMLVLSEAAKLKKDLYEQYLRPALSDRLGKVIAGTTPEGQNWYYDLWSKGQQELSNYDAAYASWRFPSYTNPHVFPKGENDPELLQLKADMTDEAFEQEIEADFDSFVGKIYPEFNKEKHIKPWKYNSLYPNYIAFDFGYTNPLAAIEFQVVNGVVHVWREHYKSFTTLDTHITELTHRLQPEDYKIDLCFGDAADPDAVNTLNMKFAPTIADPHSKTNWREGVDLVRNMLKAKSYDKATNKITETVKFYVDPSCRNIIREFNNYKANNPVKGKNVAESAINQDDHALDAIRYGLMHLFKLGYGAKMEDLYKANEPERRKVEDYKIEDLLTVYEAGFFTSNVEF